MSRYEDFMKIETEKINVKPLNKIRNNLFNELIRLFDLQSYFVLI